MIYEVPPFELLKLIRDGIITDRHDLHQKIPLSLLHMNITSILDQMERIGWLEKRHDGQIRPSPRLLEVQKVLGVSLTQLAPYNNSSVIANPVFGLPKEPPQPVDLFVLMPFACDLRALYDDHIHAVARRLQITCARADDFFAVNSVMSDVWNAITHARVLVADCTGRNPNVFYELGIAHTLGKPVILIAQKKDDIPFDVQHLRTIIYNFTPRGMQDFENTLEFTIKSELVLSRTLQDMLTRGQAAFRELRKIYKNAGGKGTDDPGSE